MNKNKTALVIGGNGLIGYGVARQLCDKDWNVRSLDIHHMPDTMKKVGVNYLIGDLFNRNFLNDAMQGVDTVFYFISSTVPKTNDDYLNNEISKTLSAIDYVLSVMVSNNVTEFVFPSSGGAVYGDALNCSNMTESTDPHPRTAYGEGKWLCEQVIGFYYNKHSVNAMIFRIGNVYGSPFYRNQKQCVVDVFVQHAIENTPITIWGNAESVIRDYVFLDDVADAIEVAASTSIRGVNVYNVGTDIGSTVADVVNCINKMIATPLEVNYDKGISSGIDIIVLDIEKIKRDLNWSPSYDLVRGIRKTIELKTRILETRIVK